MGVSAEAIADLEEVEARAGVEEMEGTETDSAAEEITGMEPEAPEPRWQAVLCKALPKLEEPESAMEDKAAEESACSAAVSEAEEVAELPEKAEKAAEQEMEDALAVVASATSLETRTGTEEMNERAPAAAPHGPAVLCKALLRPDQPIGCGRPISEAASLASTSRGTAQERSPPPPALASPSEALSFSPFVLLSLPDKLTSASYL